MKKIIFIMLLGLVCNTINAQIVTKQELEEYTNIGDMSWSAKAKELSNEYKLNELGELSLSVIKEYKGQSKSQLYRKIIDWSYLCLLMQSQLYRFQMRKKEQSWHVVICLILQNGLWEITHIE